MNKTFDAHEKFKEYFNELEGFGLRSERFYNECEAGMLREKRIIEWLKAAYMQGAQDMAQDTLDTLGDYACAVSGCKPEVLKPEEVYDRVQYNLQHYYTQVLSKEFES